MIHSSTGSQEEERQSTGDHSSDFEKNLQKLEPPSITRHLPNSISYSEQELAASTQLYRDMTAQNSSVDPPTGQSPQKAQEDYYLAQASSQEDYYLTLASSSCSDENFSSPTTPPDHGSSRGMPMRTPGLAIPTPQTKSLATTGKAALVFPHPLRTVRESPQADLTRQVSLSQSQSPSRGEKEHDHGAIQPDDFRGNKKRLYTWEEVQRAVKEKEDEVRYHLDDRHQNAIEDFRENMEKQLQEHGVQWKRDAEAEYSRLNELVRAEKLKTHQKNRELLDKVSSLADLESKLSAKAQETSDLQARVKAMEDQSNQDQLHQQIQELQKELSHFKSASKGDPQHILDLEDAKAAAEQRVEELEQLVLTTQKTVRTMVELQSPNTSMCMDDKESSTLRTELEDMRKERDSLKQKVHQLERGHGSNPEDGRDDEIRIELETQIRILKDELDRRARDFENEKRSLQADLSVIEIEELTSEVEELKKTHSDELEALRKELESSREAAISSTTERMDQFRCDYEEEILLLEEGHAQEKKRLLTEIEQLKSNHIQELDNIREKSKEEIGNQISDLQEELKRLRVEFEDEKNVIIRSSSKQVDELKTKHSEELDALRSRSQDKNEALQGQLDSSLTEKTRLESKVSSLEAQIIEMTETHKANIESTKEKIKEETVKMLEANAQSDDSKAEYTRRIREVRQEHNKEIDDLLKQLDLIEAEHNEKCSEKERLIKEKEAVISALGSQLAESQSQLEATSMTTDKLNKEVKQLEGELEAALAETDSKSSEIQRMIAAHEAVLQEEKILRDKLCAEAREEMIERAEIQFQQANTTYKKLKQEFDVAMNKISILERELERAKKDKIKIAKELERREVDLADELAQAKASIATADLNATRKVKQYRTDLERLREVESDLRKQLEEATATSRSVQTTLASVVSEKEKLIEENKEMKAVCEELMELVEGR